MTPKNYIQEFIEVLKIEIEELKQAKDNNIILKSGTLYTAYLYCIARPLYLPAQGWHTALNYGKVSCGCKRSSEGLEFEVAIPANCRALVRLPDGSEQEQAAGERRYFIAQ